jgi:multidrug transporter EmrE-like cation transporter
MKASSLLLVFVSVALNASAQLLLKQGTKAVGLMAVNVSSGGTVLLRSAFSPWVWAGLGSYVVSVALWILVLSRVELSYAYPMVSMGYVMAALAAKLFWNEQLSLVRVLGIGVICLGVFLVSRS